MTNEEITQAEAQVAGVKTKLGAMTGEPDSANLDRLAGAVEALAEVTAALLRAMRESAHAAAVARAIAQTPDNLAPIDPRD